MAMMISKFHKIIQSRIVWGIFAVAICFAFVTVYTGQKASNRNANVGVNPAKEVAGRLFGEDVSQLDYRTVYRDVYVLTDLSYLMNTGRAFNPDKEMVERMEELTWQRLATMKKGDQLGLTVTDEQLMQAIKEFPIFINPQTGGFDKNLYNGFAQQFLPRYGLSAKGFEDLIRRNTLVQKVSATATHGALVTEAEIKETFHLYNDKLTVEYASIPRSVADTPAVTEEQAKAYYSKNAEEFRLPEKAIVKYIAFNVSDYTNQVAVTDEMVANFYEQNKQRYVKPETATNSVPEYKPLEEVKQSIVDLHISGLAQQKAFEAADLVVADLSNEGTTFEQAAEKAGRTIVGNTPAFAATDRVRGIDPTAQFARAAFNLENDPTHYYSDPVVGRESVYVIALVKRLDAFLPSFENVKADAMEAARIEAAEVAYVEKADAIHIEVEAALKGGTSFADAISKYNLELQTTAPFNATSQLEDQDGRAIMGATIRFDVGTLVDLIDTQSDFLIAYVANKELADEEVTLPSMRDEIAAGIRQSKTAQLSQAWQEALLVEAGFEDLTKKTDEPGADKS
jgi:peptidyl-prolyl cis-trans isomerase D